MRMVVDLAALIQAVTLCTALLGAGAWLWRMAGRMSALMQRIALLEERGAHRKQDAEMTLRGLLACLEGLHEQGCNGRVTSAMTELTQYIIKSR